MIRDACRLFFWGFLLIMIDFRVGGFDLLPDVLGWVLMYRGLTLIREESPFFQPARQVTLPLAGWSLISLYEPPVEPGTIGTGGVFGAWGILLGLVYLAVTIWTMFQVFKGLADMADRQGVDDLKDEIHTRGLQFVALQVAVIGAFVLVFIPGLALVYILGIWIWSLVLTVMIMKTMNRSGRELATGVQQNDDSGGDWIE